VKVTAPPHKDHPERQVLILEVQMFADVLLLHWLYAETARYLLQHPGVGTGRRW
jgi:hypothetical protein